MRDHEVSDQKPYLSRAGDATAGAGTDCKLEVAWTSVSSHPVNLLLFYFFVTRTCSSCPSVARVAVLGEGSMHT